MRLSILLVSLVFLFGLGSVSATDDGLLCGPAGAGNGLIDEHECITEYLGGVTCAAAGCHGAEAMLMLGSTHYLWESPVNNKGKRNIGNTYCTNPSGSPQGSGIIRPPGVDTIVGTMDDTDGLDGIPMTADDLVGPDGILYTNDDGLEVGGGCMMCHVGFGFISMQNLGTVDANPMNWNDPNLAMGSAPEILNIDCLVCHAPTSTGYNRMSMFAGVEADPSATPGVYGDWVNNPMTSCMNRQRYMAGIGAPNFCEFDANTNGVIDAPGEYVPCTGMEWPCMYDTSGSFTVDDRIIMMDDRMTISLPSPSGIADEYWTLNGIPASGKDIEGCGARAVMADMMGPLGPMIGPQFSPTFGMVVPMNNQIAINSAQAIVGMPDSDACLRCHAGSGGSSNAKRGDLGKSNIGGVSASHDIHMGPVSEGGAGLACIDCHIVPRDDVAVNPVTGNQQLLSMEIPGMGMDMIAEVGRVTCESCHTDEPHTAINGGLNSHADFIACQTCHIPTAGKLDTTEINREWTTGAPGQILTMADPMGPMLGIPGYDNSHVNGAGIWHEHQDRSAPGGFTPEYVWWDGNNVNYLDEFDMVTVSTGTIPTNAPVGSMSDRIYPVKVQETELYIDQATNFAVPVTVGAVFQGWGIEAALRFGGMRNAQMSPQVATAFLMFDPVVANMCASLAGDPDPLNDCTGFMGHPNDQAAMGMARAYINANMVMPINVGVQMAERLGSLNHEVAPAADALDCTDCHSDSGPLDFIALGYSEPDQTFLTTLYDQSDMGDNGMTATSDVPALPAIGLAILGGSLAALAIRRMRKD